MKDSRQHTEMMIDKEGRWYFGGVEMKREDIVQYFYKYLKRDHEGGYAIEIDGDRCRVTVEDAPYVIRSITVGISGDSGPPYVGLSLNDGSSERLNLEAPLRIGTDHVLYCRVKNGEYEGRFSRPAYYQFCAHIDFDTRSEQYRFVLNHVSQPLLFFTGGDGAERGAGWAAGFVNHT